MAGRKPIYNVDSLEIGSKLELLGKAKKFKYQYNKNFNDRESGKKFKILTEGKKIFVERTA